MTSTTLANPLPKPLSVSTDALDVNELLDKEWLLTNSLGSFASGTTVMDLPATATWAAATCPALRLRTCLVHHEVTVAEEAAVQHLDRLGRFLFGRHLDESETARTPGELIRHDANRLDGAGLLEELAEILFRGLEGEVAYEQLCGHRWPPAAIRTEGTLSPGSPAAHGDDSP
jgi:hypothetical protein